jgi:hypothetical protein
MNFTDIYPNIYSYASTVLKGIQEVSKLSFFYFSELNIRNLQILIKKKIYDLSQGKYLIDDQDEQELLIIMRSIYLEYSINQDSNIRKQIDCLNNKVINEVIPQIYSAVNLYFQYIKDSTNTHLTMDRPKFESMAGTKSFDLSRFL